MHQCLQNYKQKQYYQAKHMICPPIISQATHYFDTQLPKLKHSEKYINAYETIALENRARSSLCELSANICREENSERQQERLPKKINPFGCSPWAIKKKTDLQSDTPARSKKKGKSKTTTKQQSFESDGQRCLSDKENMGCGSGWKQTSQALKKSSSIFFKIVGLREGKKTVNFKSEHPQIQMIACLQKNKLSLVEMKEPSHRNNGDRNEVGVQVNRQLTPKLVTLAHHTQIDPPKLRSKQLEASLLDNWSHDYRENKDGNIYNEHWKSRTKNIRSKYPRKVVVMRQSKSSQARQVKETYLIRKKGSVSLDKNKKEDYKSTNPLTRLLYQKYLHTIGMCQLKDHLPKYL